MELDLKNPGLPAPLWAHLDGQLWHATDCDGLSGIIDEGEIKVGFGNRYIGSFCRNQGCVSLFDFGPTARNVANQDNNMKGWFGHQQNARVPVWLEIDRASVLKNLMDAKKAREACNLFIDKRCAEGGTHEPGILIIPGVEACHSGPIPLTAIVDVLLIDQNNLDMFRRLGRPDDTSIRQIKDFESTLPAFEKDTIILALEAGRRRAFKGPI